MYKPQSLYGSISEDLERNRFVMSVVGIKPRPGRVQGLESGENIYSLFFLQFYGFAGKCYTNGDEAPHFFKQRLLGQV